jgi:1,4-dihydroxy-2-naphthoate polyprenyltransferase
MVELARPVGLGFATTSKVADVVRWADQARQKGIHAVWIHDTPYQRDAITYGTAIALSVPQIHIGLAAISTLTRHPALIAMTISALDEIAPGRIMLGLGTTIPLRLAQMGIPYTPEGGVESIDRGIDIIRSMSAGQRVPSAVPNLPPILPMFPPVHRVPIYIAAYRTAFLQLTGRKADGYIARPAESIPNLKRLLAKLRASAQEAGRDEKAVDVTGYVLTHVDKSRHEALNRAKREPFVIYMMSILSNFSLEKAGFEPALRDRIAAAWRAEDYHKAAELIPDEMLDAFALCGTPEEVAQGLARYNKAGMTMPVIQPILQEDGQIRDALRAAEIYGALALSEHQAAETERAVAVAIPGGEYDRLNLLERIWRKLGSWTEISRPFSFTISLMPILVAAALAHAAGELNLRLAAITMAASMLLQVGANVINEIYDVRNGVDSITSPRASQALLKGRINEKNAFKLAFTCFALATLFGAYLILQRGWVIALVGILGMGLGYGYTAPPIQYKYRALGIPIVFLVFGPIMTVGAYYAITGTFGPITLIASLPLGLLVAAVAHGNEWRDMEDDAHYGIGTYSTKIGRKWAHRTYIGLVTAAYIVLIVAILINDFPRASLLALLSLPYFVHLIRSAEMGNNGLQRAIAKIDLQTAQLQAVFGILFVIGLTFRI